jgi:DNA-binding SARP family transcriptional activator
LERVVTLRVYLTGNIALEDGDLLVSERGFPGRQARLTFAALAWPREGAMPVHELADVIWNGTPPRAWETALRALVSKIRSAVGDLATIEQAFGCYQLRLPTHAWIDVVAAEVAAHEAEVSFREGAFEQAMGSALVANAIARRPFLPGESGEWCERRREHLQRLRVRALEVRARVALANDDPLGAVGDAMIVADLEPYRETAHVLLMQAHAEAGNPAEALAVYETLRERLANDLGTQPTSETEKVFLEVLS